jgi:hypothetical protein
MSAAVLSRTAAPQLFIFTQRHEGTKGRPDLLRAFAPLREISSKAAFAASEF